MKKIKYLFQLSILFSYTILSTGCYTMINPPLDENYLEEGEDYISEGSSDTLDIDGNYTIINNYTCDSEASCCGHDYCHPHTDSHSYHSCDGHCSLTFNWWTSTWVSYSCNYCHHWSCSGHHHGHFYGHGYFHHDYYHNNYHYGYHDGFYDGYWWGYSDGWWNNEQNDNDYSDNDDQIERRDNSFDRSETNDDFSDNAISAVNPSPLDISDNNNQSSYNKKYNSGSSNLAVIINSTIDSKENINSRVEKRNNMALDIAKFLFTSYVNSNESSIYKPSNSKKSKSSSYSSKSKSSKKSKTSYKSSKSSPKSSSNKGKRR